MRLLGHAVGGDVKSSSVRFKRGDVLYGKMRPYLNKVWLAEFDGLCSAEFLVFPRVDGLNNEWLAFRLNAEDAVSFAMQKVSGDRPRTDFRQLTKFPLSLPPAGEQDRIVEKLVSGFAGLERAERAARRGLDRIDQYRAAVIHAAVTGELTRAWRKTYKPEETGAQLLKRLLQERRAHWEKAKLQRLKTAGKTPNDDKWKSSYPEPKPAMADQLPKLPKEWTWSSLEMIAELGSGISVSKDRVVENVVEVPYLRVANVLRGALDLSEIKKIRVNRDHLDSFLLRPGDILFNEGGDRDKLGRGWVWEGQIPMCVHQNHVFRARLVNRSLVEGKLVSHWGNSFGKQFFIRHGTQTTNLASINRSILAGLPVPVAPIAEQSVILRKLERRLATADRFATTLNRQLIRARAARQSLLRDAFSGELVPQDPKDEPASALLARIHASREVITKKPKAKRMPKSKAEFTRRPLLDVLREHKKPITPEQLFREAGFQPGEVDSFYLELASLRQVVHEKKPTAAEARTWPDGAQVRLELKGE